MLPSEGVWSRRRRRAAGALTTVEDRVRKRDWDVLFRITRSKTRLTACMLAEPLNRPLHQRLRLLRYLHSRSDCYRLER